MIVGNWNGAPFEFWAIIVQPTDVAMFVGS